MQIEIELNTFDPLYLLSNLMGREFPSIDSQEVLSEGIVVTFKQHDVRRSATIGDTITFIITFVAGIGAQVVASEITHWLHRAKEQTETLRIEREKVVIDKDQITRIIEKRIETSSGHDGPQRKKRDAKPLRNQPSKHPSELSELKIADPKETK